MPSDGTAHTGDSVSPGHHIGLLGSRVIFARASMDQASECLRNAPAETLARYRHECDGRSLRANEAQPLPANVLCRLPLFVYWLAFEQSLEILIALSESFLGGSSHEGLGNLQQTGWLRLESHDHPGRVPLWLQGVGDLVGQRA